MIFERRDNPCIKTGCTAFIAGLISHGDLFDLGDYYFLNCSSAPFRPEGDKFTIHLEARQNYTTLQQGRVVLIDKRFVTRYDYDGWSTRA